MVKTLDKKCWICGREEYIPFKCRFCGKLFCSAHRLPEQHACSGLEDLKYNASGRRTGQWDADDAMKDAFKNTAKSTARGVRSSIGRIIWSSPSLTIVFLCFASFFLQEVLSIFGNLGYWYISALMLSPAKLMAQPWTLITHMFLHKNFSHLFFNMLALFFFGPELERRVGKATFMKIYMVAGIVAGLGHSMISNASVVGASGAIMGIFATLAIIAPDIRVFVYFIPMRIIYALVLFALADFMMMGSNDMVAHAAHLTGALIGVYMGYRLKKKHRHTGWQDSYRY